MNISYLKEAWSVIWGTPQEERPMNDCMETPPPPKKEESPLSPTAQALLDDLDEHPIQLWDKIEIRYYIYLIHPKKKYTIKTVTPEYACAARLTGAGLIFIDEVEIFSPKENWRIWERIHFELAKQKKEQHELKKEEIEKKIISVPTIPETKKSETSLVYKMIVQDINSFPWDKWKLTELRPGIRLEHPEGEYVLEYKHMPDYAGYDAAFTALTPLKEIILVDGEEILSEEETVLLRDILCSKESGKVKQRALSKKEEVIKKFEERAKRETANKKEYYLPKKKKETPYIHPMSCPFPEGCNCQ